MRDSWTDDRLDDLNDKVGELARRTDNGFNRVDADLRDLRGEMSAMRTELRGETAELRSEMNARFDAMQRGFDARFDALQRTMIQFSGVMVAALIGVIATLIATQV